MTDVTVEGGLSRDNAVLLLAAVEELGEDPSVVRTTTKGFVAPKKVVDKAGLESYDPDADFNAEVEEARKAAEGDSGEHDHAAPVPEPAPVLDDEGKLVADPETTVVSSDVKADTAQEPPRTGAGSGKAAWQEYAKSKGASDADIADLGRDDLVEKYGTKE